MENKSGENSVREGVVEIVSVTLLVASVTFLELALPAIGVL